MSTDDDTDPEEHGLVARSYTGFFQIRKRMRRIQDIDLPFRHGLGVDQFIAFVIALVLMLVLYGLVVSPLKVLLGWSPPWQVYLLYFLGPPVLAAFRIGKPMPYSKSISGTIMSWLRHYLDDPVHRRGMPVPAAQHPARRMHYARTWSSNPNGEPGRETAPQTAHPDRVDRPAPVGAAIDLGEWMAAERAAAAAEKHHNDHIDHEDTSPPHRRLTTADSTVTVADPGEGPTATPELQEHGW